MAYTPLELAKVAAFAADSKKATDIELMDLTKLSDVCDYFLILSAMNSRQADALIDEIEEKVAKNCGVKPISIEGRANLSWVLMDYGSVVVHVFLPETRDYYRLERLWGEAPRVELDLQ
ncbi:MAG: ribosome silencing factor [Atopobiaceae bacterium]|nr:ribosome silencing factor [Atopobiaceae bacterium]MBQ6521348.1 ribosome silencing factor [Atopobiaceae bacterium]